MPLLISCDDRLPGVIADVGRLITEVRPQFGLFHVKAPAAIVVQAGWKHWPCLFPQHGPGRKHEQSIRLEDWQRSVVEAEPGAFLRGHFHSDGSRVHNWATRIVAGERRRYEYPRWQFVNHSADILDLCCWALDLVGVRWRRSARGRRGTVSVSRADDVAALDALIGPKS